MPVRTFFIIASLAAASFGIGFTVAPVFVGSLFMINLDADGEMIARFFGALLISVAIWFYWMRGTEDVKMIRVMLTGYLVGLIPGLYNAIASTLVGTMNGLGWLVVLMYGGLAVGAAYFLFAQPYLRAAGAAAR